MGSEMCIRDRLLLHADPLNARDEARAVGRPHQIGDLARALLRGCLLYTSDAADERSSVDLGGRRIIKKKNNASN